MAKQWLCRADDVSATPQPAPVDLEDPEVAAGDVDGDVVDGDLADPPRKRAGVGMAVQDDVDWRTERMELPPDPRTDAMLR